MSARVLILTLLLPLCARAVAPESGPEALRNLLKMPTMTVSIGWNVDAKRGVVYGGEVLQVPDKIARLRKQLNESPTSSDAERYMELADYYGDLKDTNNATTCAEKAVDLFRKQLESRPDDGHLMSKFGFAVAMAHGTEEAEPILRKAVTLSPKDEECWENLGTVLSARSTSMLTFGEQQTANAPAEKLLREKVENVLKPPTDQLAKAQKLYDEALDCFNRAVQLAPSNAVAYSRRGSFKFAHDYIESAVGAMRHPKEDAHTSVSAMTLDSSLSDFDKAVSLSPDDPLLVGQSMFVEFMSAMTKAEQRAGKSPLELMPAKNANSLRAKLAVLEKIGKTGNAKKAAEALEIVAVWRSSLFGEREVGDREVVTSARRAIELDPSREAAWQLLMLGLDHGGSYEELIKVSQAYLNKNKTDESRMLLAKAYFDAKQFQNAEEQVNAILENNPNDFKANVASAVLILHRSQKLSEMVVAERRLRTALETVKREAKSQEEAREPMIDVMLTHAIYCGMIGLPDDALQLVAAVLEYDKDNERAKQIRAAIKTN